MYPFHIKSAFVGVFFDSSDEGSGRVSGDGSVEIAFSSLEDSDRGVTMLGLEFEMPCAFGAYLAGFSDHQIFYQK